MTKIWQIGDRIQNRWEIYNILRGGMGVVYIVYDHDRHEPFAIKSFQDEIFIRNPNIADRFIQEALAWINIDIHENVVSAAFVDSIEGRPYLFLEYVSGGDLSNWIGTRRLTDNLSQALHFAIQFCDGMNHARSKGIKAHRDIKPQNCLITEDKTLKVSDFGLAKVFDDIDSEDAKFSVSTGLNTNLTRTGIAAGTCTHMAPEQFENAKYVDVRADIYSFGVMLFEMITGKLPFSGKKWEEFEYMHKHQPPPQLNSFSSDVNTVIQTCLSKHPAHRFGDFSEVREQIAEIYEQLTGNLAPQPAAGKELDMAQWANKGWSLSNLEQYLQAIACCDHVLANHPKAGMLWTNKGRALSGLKRFEEAIDCFDRAIELNPNDFAAWSNKGQALSELGQHKEGLACCNRALEIDPHFAMAWNNKSKCLTDSGQQKEAMDCIDRALELNPRFDLALYNKAVVLERSGLPEQAFQYYSRALDINPRSAPAWNNIGNALNDSERFDEALTCLSRAIAINPHLEEAWNNKGRALHGMDRYEEALVCYERAMELNPNISRTWLNKGMTLMTLAKHNEAFACFDRALELNPHEERVWFARGVTLIDLDQPEQALVCFNRVIEMNSNWGMVWYCKGMTLAQLGQPEEAITCFDRALELDPNNADAWYRKGAALDDLDQIEEAIDCCVSALKIDPGLADAWFSLGMKFARTGRLTPAIECLEEAHSLGHPGALEGIETCRMILGKQ